MQLQKFWRMIQIWPKRKKQMELREKKEEDAVLRLRAGRRIL
jgi:hypothetical protein